MAEELQPTDPEQAISPEEQARIIGQLEGIRDSLLNRVSDSLQPDAATKPIDTRHYVYSMRLVIECLAIMSGYKVSDAPSERAVSRKAVFNVVDSLTLPSKAA